MKICANCKKENEDQFTFCPYCGKKEQVSISQHMNVPAMNAFSTWSISKRLAFFVSLLLVCSIGCNALKSLVNDPDSERQKQFQQEVNQILSRDDLTLKQLDEVWMEHQCGVWVSFVVYQKLEDDLYEVGYVLMMRPISRFTGRALLRTRTIGWDSPGEARGPERTTGWNTAGYSGPVLFTAMLETRPVKMTDGFTKDVSVYEESLECEDLWYKIKKTNR